MKASNNVYQIITDKVLSAIENGVAPWHCPWSTADGAVSHVNGKRYSFVNQLLLAMQSQANGCENKEWLTFNQIKAAGGSIKKGEKGSYVVFWTMVEKTKEDPETGENNITRFPILRYYNVFEVSQCEGIKRKYEGKQTAIANPIEEAESIIGNYFSRETCKLEIRHQNKAYYSPSFDLVSVPEIKQYENVSEYYSTMFHEMTHSTGHKSRLDRDLNGIAAFGDESYAREELTAEFGACYLCHRSGIEDTSATKNSASYLKGWSQAIKNDPKMFITAASKAEAAAKYILGETKDEE